MAGYYLLASILCLALANAISAQSVMEGYYNVTEVCTMVKPGTQLGSVVSCNYYYTCTTSGPVKQACSPGYAYNYKTQNCAPASQVECYYGMANPCTGKTGNNWVPNVDNCQEWIYCVGEQIYGRGSCVKGEIFKASEQRCVYGVCPDSGVNVAAPSENYFCSVVPPNMYFGSTSSCQAWFYCSSQGVLSTGNCASSAFIVSSGTCGYDTTPGACDRVVSAPIPTKCSVKGQRTPDPTVCGNYYVCDGSTFVLNQCPTGSYYDITKFICVPRQAASPVSGCNRCQYANTAFVNAVNYKSCDSYYYCHEGINGQTSTCEEGYYFNEADQACLPSSGLSIYDNTNGACAGAIAVTTDASIDSTTTKETTTTTPAVTTDKPKTTESTVTTTKTK